MWMFFLDNNDLKQCRSKVLTLVRKGRLADVLRYHWRSKHFLDVQATLPETLDVGRGRLGSGFGDWKMLWNYIRKPSAKTLFPKKIIVEVQKPSILGFLNPFNLMQHFGNWHEQMVIIWTDQFGHHAKLQPTKSIQICLPERTRNHIMSFDFVIVRNSNHS